MNVVGKFIITDSEDNKRTISVESYEFNDELNLGFLGDEFTLPKAIAMVKALGSENIVEFALEELNGDEFNRENVRMFLKSWRNYNEAMDGEADFSETGLYENICEYFEEEGFSIV